MTTDEFVEKYMGDWASPQQRQAIDNFLYAEVRSVIWTGGRGGGKTTVRNAMRRYIEDQEASGS